MGLSEANITLPVTPFHFDTAPFILLNLCLSFVAAFQAPVIMMSQNRQASRDKHESIIDFAINYKAEQKLMTCKVIYTGLKVNY
jgi:uncharacterized membrane protein